jgi:hypothetical protein
LSAVPAIDTPHGNRHALAMTGHRSDPTAARPLEPTPEHRRRAQALRENLRRRKAQAQARAAAAGDDVVAARPADETPQT